MRALITGVAGFAGSHLAEHLVANTDLEVYGVVRSNDEKVAHLRPQVQLLSGNLLDLQRVRSILRQAKPDYVFHLAAQAFVPQSWRDPWGTLENNIKGQLNLLESMLELEMGSRLLAVGSADEYGLVASEELPIRETTPLRPYSPYAVSKVAQDMLGFQYFASHGLPVIRVRPFNHIGPRQSSSFVVSSFARQIAEAEAGRREEVVEVGNLDARRDFSDVRDIVRGYYLALTEGEPGEVYNLGAERATSIRGILDTLLDLSEASLEIRPDPERLRPSEVPVVVSDCGKFRERTGWQPEIPLAKSLRDVLDDWRARTR